MDGPRSSTDRASDFESEGCRFKSCRGHQFVSGEIRLESADRAAGYWTTRSETRPEVKARTSGVYLRAESGDVSILDDQDNEQRSKLIADRLMRWKSIKGA